MELPNICRSPNAVGVNTFRRVIRRDMRRAMKEWGTMSKDYENMIFWVKEVAN
jgi:hypothetical protein